MVDYIIVNERLFPSCKTLSISNPNNLSDHAFVTATLEIGTVCPPDTNFQGKAYKSANIFKCDDGSTMNFHTALSSSHITGLMDDLSNLLWYLSTKHGALTKSAAL